MARNNFIFDHISIHSERSASIHWLDAQFGCRLHMWVWLPDLTPQTYISDDRCDPPKTRIVIFKNPPPGIDHTHPKYFTTRRLDGKYHMKLIEDTLAYIKKNNLLEQAQHKLKESA